jgi:hypothetical protein
MRATIMNNQPKYPNVHVKLAGEDGNAFYILSRCYQAANKANLDKREIEAFTDEATSGDYDNLLQTCMKWFNCDSEEVEKNVT